MPVFPPRFLAPSSLSLSFYYSPFASWSFHSLLSLSLHTYLSLLSSSLYLSLSWPSSLIYLFCLSYYLCPLPLLSPSLSFLTLYPSFSYFSPLYYISLLPTISPSPSPTFSFLALYPRLFCSLFLPIISACSLLSSPPLS